MIADARRGPYRSPLLSKPLTARSFPASILGNAGGAPPRAGGRIADMPNLQAEAGSRVGIMILLALGIDPDRGRTNSQSLEIAFEAEPITPADRIARPCPARMPNRIEDTHDVGRIIEDRDSSRREATARSGAAGSRTANRDRRHGERDHAAMRALPAASAVLPHVQSKRSTPGELTYPIRRKTNQQPIPTLAPGNRCMLTLHHTDRAPPSSLRPGGGRDVFSLQSRFAPHQVGVVIQPSGGAAINRRGSAVC